MSLAAAALLLASSTTGCGKSEPELARELAGARARELALTGPELIARYRLRSPERTLLELWRSLQLGDAARAWSYLGPTARTRAARKIVPTLAGVASRFALVQPRARVRGNRATIPLTIGLRKPVGGARPIASGLWALELPLQATLERRDRARGGGWLVTRVGPLPRRARVSGATRKPRGGTEHPGAATQKVRQPTTAPRG